MNGNTREPESDFLHHGAERMNHEVRMKGERSTLSGQLAVRLTNAIWDANLLEELPYAEVMPRLAMYCEVIATSDNGHQWRTRISKEMMQDWGLERKELIENAIRSSLQERPPTLLVYENDGIRTDNLLIQTEALPMRSNSMYILTTQDFLFGAVALFYPGVQERLSVLMGGNYYAIPSSVHEFIILPDDEIYTHEFLIRMLLSANRDVVAPEDRLAESLYYFNAEQGCLVCCEETYDSSVECDVPRIPNVTEGCAYPIEA